MDTRDPATRSAFRDADDARGEPSALRRRITAQTRTPEPEAVAFLLPLARMTPAASRQAHDLAVRLAQRLRERKAAGGRAGLVQGLLQEYALSSQEGVALMCLAEALLRIPDKATRDALIRDKIARGQWRDHAGRSPSLFVNAATWGLLLTGKLVSTHSEATLSTLLTRLIGKGGEPVIRKGVDLAMRMMGEQFVTGETIAEALEHARPLEAQGFRYSYDMLGEAAMTAEDADRYRKAYEDAIHAIGRAAGGRGVVDGPGISIKLSALHPRYARAQQARVMDELYPVLRGLAQMARRYDIGLNIDAEEADRLELSLGLLERLCFEPSLAGWDGIGFVIQAYQKRCPFVIDHVIDLARRSRHRLMVRLVKGAYWDSEIKRAQVDGQDGFPVYTRKVYTDLSYLACARRLLEAPAEVYPQFATHNAHTMAAIYTLADPAAWRPGQYEFQCLHGMGEPLYEQVVGPVEAGRLGRPCRIYAPVGTHETLLAYLVRRLLENGANTSFVNRVADASLPIEALVEDPVAAVERMAEQEQSLGRSHPMIPHPAQLYGGARRNSQGLDLANEDTLRMLGDAFADGAQRAWSAQPMLGDQGQGQGQGDRTGEVPAGVARLPDAADTTPDDGAQGAAAWAAVVNPADRRDVVGRVRAAGPDEVQSALRAAEACAPAWAATPPADRAAALERAADLLQQRLPALLGLLAREAGKTCANGIAEVREAVDFLRFYAGQARAGFAVGTHRPLGPVVCISPWNFPLAIFLGQVGAALAAGNPVLAKPAEQTPLVAAEGVRCLREAGVPAAAVQLLPGDGATVGAALVADARVQAVMFTGSTEVARLIQRQLARRLGRDGGPVPLIAETGGQNAMIVDSSALVEQVVADVLGSAFDSAGQRCSALRLLCLQDDVADRALAMLRGAMAELNVGDPARLRTDVGPVIDAEARAGIDAHLAAMRGRGRRVVQLGRAPHEVLERGTFVVPALIELDSVSELTREVFGPVLHVVRYAREELDTLLAAVAATGYGLTMGLHTRIDETIRAVLQQARVGNVYVNRNMVGAVVGVQPFGGEGLSGTGPKAGGPLYMHRLLASRPAQALDGWVDEAVPGAVDAEAPGRTGHGGPSGSGPASPASRLGMPGTVGTSASGTPGEGMSRPAALESLLRWLQARGQARLAMRCGQLADRLGRARSWVLPGPTGERNVYAWLPREAALCLAASDEALLLQLGATLAAGSRAIWPSRPGSDALHASLPADVRERVALATDWSAPGVVFDVALFQGSGDDLLAAAQRLAARDGPIVQLRRVDADADADTDTDTDTDTDADGDRLVAAWPVEALLVERAVSTNTAAAGGNASLMTIA